MKILNQPCALRPPLDPVRAAFFGRSKAYTLLKVDLSADPGKIHWGFDPPNLDPASGENDDPTVYWASVVQGGTNNTNTNNIVNLNISGGNFSNFEWIKNSGDGATVTHDETASGDSSDLTITATGSGDEIQVAEFHLVLKGSTTPLLTLNVMVLPQRGPISLGIYHIQDTTSQGTVFSNRQSASAFVAKCNEVFQQAGITFENHTSSDNSISVLRDYDYDNKEIQWDAESDVWIEQDGQDGKVSLSEVQALAVVLPDEPADVDVFLLKEGAEPYDTNDPSPFYKRGRTLSNPPAIILYVANTEDYREIAVAHEVGHFFDLSTANDPDPSPLSSDHDNPPYSQQVVDGLQDLNPPNAPANHISEPNAALMQSGWPEENGMRWLWGMWMRHEDWDRANRNAASF